MKYCITIKYRDGTVLRDQGPFGTLQNALDHIFEEGYLKSPECPFHNNAYVSIGEQGISNLFISTTTAGLTNLHLSVQSISIMDDATRIAVAKGHTKDKTTH